MMQLQVAWAYIAGIQVSEAARLRNLGDEAGTPEKGRQQDDAGHVPRISPRIEQRAHRTQGNAHEPQRRRCLPRGKHDVLVQALGDGAVEGLTDICTLVKEVHSPSPLIYSAPNA